MTSSKIKVGLEKQPGKGKGEAKLIVNSEKKGTMIYNAKEEILKVTFFYGYWNSSLNRGCKVES